jgi:GNAT superfamily N-acetyltransferase
MDRRAALEVVRTTLAADHACKPEDWLNDEITIVEAREVIGRRRFPLHVKEFIMTTMGRGVVIACSADRLTWAEAHLRQRSRDELFAAPTLAQIVGLVTPDQQRLAGPVLWSICGNDTLRMAEAPTGFVIEVFGREQMAEVYRFEGFDHALSYRMDHPCPEMIAVVATYGSQVVGIAGVSADNEQLWQIGIDVVPKHQGMGLGKALVSRATQAVLERGKTPYYGHYISNMASGNTARSVGYQWAWMSTYVRDLYL